MRPSFTLLDSDLVRRILAETRDLLETLGLEIHNPAVQEMLLAEGARLDPATSRVCLGAALVDRAVALAPRTLPPARRPQPRNALPRQRHGVVHAGIGRDQHPRQRTGKIRKPTTADYVRYAKLVSGLPHIASQSTAFIPADVPSTFPTATASSSVCCTAKSRSSPERSPRGVRTDEEPAARRARQAEALAAKPLTIFSCCPTSPLKWSDVTSQNVVDCARYFDPGRIRLDAAFRIHGAGHARRHADPAHGRDAQRRGHQPAEPTRERRCCTAARPPSSTSATRRRRWARSRR